MITKPLNDIFDEIVQEMFDSIELPTDENVASFSFCFEEYGYCIEGSGRVGGDWNEFGGGYWSQSEYTLSNGWGDLKKLTITHYDEENDEETEFSEDVIRNIIVRLDKELSDYMKNY